MVFSLITGVISGVADVLDEVGSGLDEGLFGGVSDRTKRKMIEEYKEMRMAGLSDSSIQDHLYMKYLL